jgi:hypothetical protein
VSRFFVGMGGEGVMNVRNVAISKSLQLFHVGS